VSQFLSKSLHANRSLSHANRVSGRAFPNGFRMPETEGSKLPPSGPSSLQRLEADLCARAKSRVFGERQEISFSAGVRGGGCTPDRTGLQLKFPANREINREFCRFRPSCPIFHAQSASEFSGLQLKFPYATEQGIFGGLTGNSLERTGNLIEGSGKAADLDQGCPPNASLPRLQSFACTR
jgi:hypothetical protein